jgi:hypothetical protein
VKETHFFDDDIYPRYNAHANVHQHSLKEYEQYFAHHTSEKRVMEATPIYLYQETAVAQFSAFAEKPKVLFVLREPAQRAYSQFRFNKYRLGNIEQNLPYEQYLGQMANSKGDPLARGHYIQFLDKWVAGLGTGNVYAIQSEKLFPNRVEEMKKIALFLDIDPDFYDQFDFMKRNETLKMRSTKLHRLGLKVQPSVPQFIQEKVLIPLYLKLNATAMPPVSKVDKNLVQSQKDLFQESNERLTKSFPNIDLNLWK